LFQRPIQPIDIQTIVEESEERLTEQQIDEIIDIIEESLPAPAPAVIVPEETPEEEA